MAQNTIFVLCIVQPCDKRGPAEVLELSDFSTNVETSNGAGVNRNGFKAARSGRIQDTARVSASETEHHHFVTYLKGPIVKRLDIYIHTCTQI